MTERATIYEPGDTVYTAVEGHIRVFTVTEDGSLQEDPIGVR